MYSNSGINNNNESERHNINLIKMNTESKLIRRLQWVFELVAVKISRKIVRDYRALYLFRRCKMKQIRAQANQKKVKKPQRDLLGTTMSVLNFLVAQPFGLLSACYDSQTNRLMPSRGWLIFCSLIGHAFICIYPIAVAQIMQHRKSLHDDDSGLSRKIEILQHAIMYLLSVFVYVRQMYFAKHQMNTVNRGLIFYQRCKTLGGDDMNTANYIYPCILRAIFSYIGYALLNFLSIFHFYGDLAQVSFVYKIAFFMPNIVITTTTIRFHSAVVLLTVGGIRINRAFRNCIESVNRTQNAMRAKQLRACQLATERFEYIVTYHGEWYAMASIMEKGLSILMLCTCTNIVINLTSTVSIFGPEVNYNFILISFKVLLFVRSADE